MKKRTTVLTNNFEFYKDYYAFYVLVLTKTSSKIAKEFEFP